MLTVSFPEWPAGQALLALSMPLAAIAGAGLDRLLGEPRRWHPLLGFGALAGAVERTLNASDGGDRHRAHNSRSVRGLLAWSLLVLPLPALAVWLTPAGLRFADAAGAEFLRNEEPPRVALFTPGAGAPTFRAPWRSR